MLAERLLPLYDLVVDLFGSNGIRPPHRAAVIPREAVAEQPGDVLVAGAQGESLPNTYALFGSVTSGMSVVDTINQQGSTSGVPPDVTQRMLSVTISDS